MNRWKYRITARREENASFEQNRDWFAAALQGSAWFKAKAEEDSPLWWLWGEIKDADDVEHFDLVLNAIYDEADADRCWIEFKAGER